MSSKVIIIATLLLIAVSFSVLFVIETKNHNYDFDKSWTVVYFDNPRNSSLEFMIENHQGSKTEYAYEIFVNDQSVAKNRVEIAAGAKQKIEPILDLNKYRAGSENARVEIDVSLGEVKYKIYKDIK